MSNLQKKFKFPIAFKVDHFKSKEEAKNFLEQNIGFAECLRVCVNGEGAFGKSFIKEFTALAKKLERNIKTNDTGETITFDLNDEIGLFIVNVIYEICWLRLSEEVRTNITDSEIVKSLCQAMYNESEDKTFFFGIEFSVNEMESIGSVNRILVNKGFKINKFFEIIEKNLLKKECVFSIKGITVFSGEFEDDWKFIPMKTEEEAQRFLDRV